MRMPGGIDITKKKKTLQSIHYKTFITINRQYSRIDNFHKYVHILLILLEIVSKYDSD